MVMGARPRPLPGTPSHPSWNRQGSLFLNPSSRSVCPSPQAHVWGPQLIRAPEEQGHSLAYQNPTLAGAGPSPRKSQGL